MALIDGKQIRDVSISLYKLKGFSGIVTFTQSATMSFDSGSALRQSDNNILVGTDVVNKNYVDSVAQGLHIKKAVKAISLDPISLSGTQSIDGYLLAVGDRVLVNGQAGLNATASNGIYVVDSGAWVRAIDADGDPVGEVEEGDFTFVAHGQIYENTGWVLGITDAVDHSNILVGTESQLWVQFSSAGLVQAGDGLLKTGNIIDVVTGTGITISSDTVAIADTGVVADSYGAADQVTTFTVNAQGQLTAAGTASINIVSTQISDFDQAAEAAVFETDNFVDGETIDFTVFGATGVGAEVTLGSLTASRFNIINSASASQGWQLGYNTSGQFEWFDPTLVGDITDVVAGIGLTGGGTSGSVTLDINLGINSGLTFSGDDIIIDPNISGNGLDFSSGVLSVNTSEITTALAGEGLIANGSSIDVQVDTTGLTVSGDTVRLNTTITGDRTFQDSVIINGDLTVNGTTSYINTENLYVEDNIITLNANYSGPYNAIDAGIEVNLGGGTFASLIWDSSESLWALGLSGSESTIITEAGDGLNKSGNTLSVNVGNGISLEFDTVVLGGTLSQNTIINGSQSYSFIIDEISDFGLSFSGSATISVGGLTQGLVYSATPSSAAPLTLIHKQYVDQQIDDLADVDGISIILNNSNKISISATISGHGLTYSTSTGIMDINWGGTSSGLTFSNNNELKVNVDGSTIIVNNLGQLQVLAGSAQPVYDEYNAVETTGNDFAITGVTLSSIPNDYSRIQVYVNGQLQRLGDNVTTKDCYFGTVPSTPIALSDLTLGSQLYWNGLIAGFDLSASDKIDIVYES